MKGNRIFGALAFCGVVAVANVGAIRPMESTWHLALVKSVPEKDARVESVSEIRLVFSQVPQKKATSIRLLDGAGSVIPLGEVAADATDGKVQVATADAAVPAGTYTVAWRTMSADGHVVRGEYGFSVAAAR
ncbi:MAG: copper resistance protein CopC [Gemmatimonadota bacterium]